MGAISTDKKPEFRKDPLTGRWVIIAPGRSQRPQDYDTAVRRVRSGPCPFCEGNESETTPEVLARRHPNSEPNGPGWRVRVVSNKYPAVCSGMPAADSTFAASCFPGLGIHDVIVDTPRHVASLTDMAISEVTELLDVFRERLAQLSNEPYLEYALIFKNVGPTAGASLEHSHSQLLAIPMVPPLFGSELEAARRWSEREGQCYYCQLLSQEQAGGDRIVLRHSGFTAFCPFVSRFAYEIWIFPDTHAERFEAMTPGSLSSLAETIQSVLKAIETRLGKPGYNVLLHTAPFRKKTPYFHWRIEILPSVSRAAGFEWGTGIHINPVFPEEAAQTLRGS
ncbi:Galactose-1-phosphate uridylyltransferase [Thermogutta terrifontis]|uniref:Galactose-1-phosphate uridylyltransferase n=1 Tax=Thermogutta terrifontis TaxID=1331910 RepID=A0A286RK83_9BACT|nr:DUF4921 family protein [Thermogutta terrifontis]ASV76385.1 Galactose-1-phosphate uridylyltransferase [Thermogutta terrifontis]